MANSNENYDSKFVNENIWAIQNTFQLAVNNLEQVFSSLKNTIQTIIELSASQTQFDIRQVIHDLPLYDAIQTSLTILKDLKSSLQQIKPNSMEIHEINVKLVATIECQKALERIIKEAVTYIDGMTESWTKISEFTSTLEIDGEERKLFEDFQKLSSFVEEQLSQVRVVLKIDFAGIFKIEKRNGLMMLHDYWTNTLNGISERYQIKQREINAFSMKIEKFTMEYSEIVRKAAEVGQKLLQLDKEVYIRNEKIDYLLENPESGSSQVEDKTPKLSQNLDAEGDLNNIIENRLLEDDVIPDFQIETN